MCMQKNKSLFATTYRSMIDRTTENGYAKTSITGAYPGMFGRDSSIQIMAHIAAGDYDLAAKIMSFIIRYHERHSADYVLHIMYNDEAPVFDTTPPDLTLQPDAAFFFLHAWYLYATQAPESEIKTAFLKASENKVITFADFFLTPEYLHENNLMLNPALEHSRDVRYWCSYDILTNVYASQCWHELSLYFAESNPEKAKIWSKAANDISDAVHKHLVWDIDGATAYAELIDAEHDNVMVPGFSWVSIAPMSCDWFAADPDILEHTYKCYLKYGACDYYNKYRMLDVCTTYNGTELTSGDHVIGKGLAWEIIYCKKMGYTDRLNTLLSFIEEGSDDMYRENWSYKGGGPDTANQEQAGWMLYAMKTCFPELETAE